MKPKRALVSLACTAALVLLLADSGPAIAAEAGAHTPTTPATHAVAIEAMQFSPDSLAVSVGDTVVWINKDPFPHTVTVEGRWFRLSRNRPGQVMAIPDPQSGCISLCLHPAYDYERYVAGPLTPGRAFARALVFLVCVR